MNQKKLVLTGHDLSIENVIEVSRHYRPVEIDKAAKKRIDAAYRIVTEIEDSGVPTYGINTGFGEFSKVCISRDENGALQKNLVMSHACGAGPAFSEEVVRAIMLLRLNTHCSGFSGVSPEVPQILCDMLNHHITPYVPEKGSLGASGDLANLAHIALVMIGLGEVIEDGVRKPAAEVLKREGLTPVVLKGKDALGITNGTPVMTGVGCLAFHDAEICLKAANMGAALTFEAFRGITAALDPRVHKLRPHPGQLEVASFILKMLEGSSSINTRKGDVQDPYTLRCVPQVHGAVSDALRHVREELEIEINSVTDNPLVFPDKGDVISGGNFHGEPMALNMDFLGMAAAELADIAERRIERMVNPQLNGGLPAFLVANGGVNSGFMIPQYTAAALVSENKVLAHPASVDSIPSSANKEDHVSMGTISARKAFEIVKNVRQVLAVEWIVSAQACEFRKVEHFGRGTARMMKEIRKIVPHLEDDRVLYPDMHAMDHAIREGEIVDKIEASLKTSAKTGSKAGSADRRKKD